MPHNRAGDQSDCQHFWASHEMKLSFECGVRVNEPQHASFTQQCFSVRSRWSIMLHQRENRNPVQHRTAKWRSRPNTEEFKLLSFHSQCPSSVLTINTHNRDDALVTIREGVCFTIGNLGGQKDKTPVENIR